jgi:hypothetical protein
MAPQGDTNGATKRPNTDDNTTSAKRPRIEVLSSFTDVESKDEPEDIPFPFIIMPDGQELRSRALQSLKSKILETGANLKQMDVRIAELEELKRTRDDLAAQYLESLELYVRHITMFWISNINKMVKMPCR